MDNEINEMQQLLKQVRENREKTQNLFIDKLFDMVENLCQKANKRDYVPTTHEKDVFKKIYTIIINMNNWF